MKLKTFTECCTKKPCAVSFSCKNFFQEINAWIEFRQKSFFSYFTHRVARKKKAALETQDLLKNFLRKLKAFLSLEAWSREKKNPIFLSKIGYSPKHKICYKMFTEAETIYRAFTIGGGV